jgi:hypothetical protein
MASSPSFSPSRFLRSANPSCSVPETARRRLLLSETRLPLLLLRCFCCCCCSSSSSSKPLDVSSSSSRFPQSRPLRSSFSPPPFREPRRRLKLKSKDFRAMNEPKRPTMIPERKDDDEDDEDEEDDDDIFIIFFVRGVCCDKNQHKKFRVAH